MLRLIRFIFTGDWHMHEWKAYRVERVSEIPDGPTIEFHHIRECSVCGKLKNFKT